MPVSSSTMRRPAFLSLSAFSVATWFLSSLWTTNVSHAWVVLPTTTTTTPTTRRQRAVSASRLFSSSTAKPRKPSRVQDPDGPTPETRDDSDLEEVDPQTVEGLREIMSQDDLPRPIPHQPWRRGTMDGCDDPIDADWRQAAEQVIKTAVYCVGGEVYDVTWFLTAVVVHLNHTVIPAELAATGPAIDIMPHGFDVQYQDPSDPNPPDVTDPSEVLYQRQTEDDREEERARKEKRWADKDEDDDPNEPHNPEEAVEPVSNLYMNQETRATLGPPGDTGERIQKHQHHKSVLTVHQISMIAEAIKEGLGEIEEELRVLERHELILASLPMPSIIETQKQFDEHRGEPVIVETQDPWNSNRSIKGRLVDRNTLDVYVNQQGRLVTIPQVFVSKVIIPNYFYHEYQKDKAEGRLEKGFTYQVEGEEPYVVPDDGVEEEEEEEESNSSGPMP